MDYCNAPQLRGITNPQLISTRDKLTTLVAHEWSPNESVLPKGEQFVI
jgi:hypothetical protein